MENNTFKSVTFGGFAKQDVIDYIEKTARENATVQEKLQQENEGLQSSNTMLNQQVEELKNQVDALMAETEQLRRELDRERTVRLEVEPCKDEAARLAAEVERLRPDAEAYAQFREQIGAIECEARKRAADLESATVSRLEYVANAFRGQYQSLMTAFESTAAHVSGELRKVEVNLAQLPRAMDQAGAELKELETVFSRITKKEGT